MKDEFCVNVQPHSSALIKYLSIEKNQHKKSWKNSIRAQAFFAKLTLRYLM